MTGGIWVTIIKLSLSVLPEFPEGKTRDNTYCRMKKPENVVPLRKTERGSNHRQANQPVLDETQESSFFNKKAIRLGGSDSGQVWRRRTRHESRGQSVPNMKKGASYYGTEDPPL